MMGENVPEHGGPGEGVGQGENSGSRGGTTVEDRLADLYQGSVELDWRYALAALAVAVGWWLLFGPLSAFIAGMGLVVLISGIDPTLVALRSRQWPRTEAVVLESTVFTVRELRDSFDGLSRTGSTRGGYVPFVRYEYTVDGETYVNVRISPFDGKIPRRRWAERVTANYEEGTRMSVPYDPSDPSQSFLQTWTWSNRLLVFLAGSTVFLAPAIWLAADAPLPTDIAIPDIVLIGGFASLFVLLGLYMMLNGLRTYRWPKTTGVVRGKGVSSSSGGEGGTTSYSPQLRYEYQVDGDSYESSSIAVGSGPSFSSRSKARDWLEDYPDDGEVTVRYNPRRPDKSVLKPGGFLQGLILLLISGGALTVFVLLETGNEQLLVRFLDQLPIDWLVRQLPV